MHVFSELSAMDRYRLLRAALDRRRDELGCYDWDGGMYGEPVARPNQLPPVGDWTYWLLLAGRGFGKTRTGAEWVRMRVREGARRIGLVARSAADARDVLVEGESGVMAVHPPHERPVYEPSKRRLTWPNGAVGTVFSADEPNTLRGPQFDTVWADELAAWVQVDDAWSNLTFGLRLSFLNRDGVRRKARCLVSTTPRPLKVLKGLVEREGSSVVVTRGSSYDNLANLSENVREDMLSQYEGTRLGRQEIYGEILWDNPGALWNTDMLDGLRLSGVGQPGHPLGVLDARERFGCPELRRVVVAVDPATTAGEKSDETGVVVAGLASDGHAYVLADRSLRGSPREWAGVVVGAFRDFEADRVIAEKNQGGEMVDHTLRSVDHHLPVKLISATRGKVLRAEPVAARYEQGYVHHVGNFPLLEGQMCTFAPDSVQEFEGSSGKKKRSSPDRVDALVHALTELAPGKRRKATW